ncbi:MAG: glycoside hydrolase [Acidobacteria bacterium]|nr:MAG: glycoside hydrolase [Acidobacteriota bacterium]
MHDPTTLLLPPPRSTSRLPGRWTVPPRPAISGGEDLGPANGVLCRALAQLGLEPRATTGDAALRLRLDPAAGGHPQGYVLSAGREGATVASPSPAGLFYGASTLVQWLAVAGRRRPDGTIEVPAIRIDDRPSFAHRGVMLDVSRDKVPTMSTLYALVDRLAGWKINQLQLYVEHTFAYRGHEVVWRDASPLTGEEMRQLDAYCRQRFVELVPNQQSFGHFHRWLIHPPYRSLAECPEGIDHPFSRRREPYGLCPIDPGSLALIEDLYAQLLPNFTSRQLNAGLDETLDLGRGRSAAACAARGKTTVYLDFVRRVHELAGRHGRRLQLWGDVILEHPERLEELPADVVALAWGYEADHPFATVAAQLARSGREFYLCPGTSSWLSFAGRTDNALRNLASAARHGRTHGAAGLLITDWGDCGHLQPLPASWPGLVAGAAFAWNAGAARDPLAAPWAALLDRHVYGPGEALGAATLALGNAYRRTGTPSVNGSALFHLLIHPEDDLTHPRYRGLTAAALEATAAHLVAAVGLLPADGGLERRELVWVAELLRLAVDLGRARLEAGAEHPPAALPASLRRRLATRLDDLIAEHRPLWLARNRDGGRRDSVARFDPLRRLLR